MLGEYAGGNHDGEPPLGDDASENHHDREPPEVGLILLSSFFFFSAPTRLRRENFWRGIFWPRPSEFGGFYKKSTCSIT